MADEIGTSKRSMTTLGERLKGAREKRELTIDQVHKQTHIHSTVLRALEEGRCDDILTPTYVRSFLKKYAHHVGVDVKWVLDEYDLINSAKAGGKGPREEKMPEVKSSEIASHFIHALSIILLLIALLLLISFLGKRIFSYLSSVRKSRPAMTSPAVLPGKGKAVKTRQVITPVRSKTAAKAKPAQQAPAPARSPAAVQTAVKSGPFRLTIKVNKAVMVELKRDGEVLFKRLLSKGTVETFSANNKIEIYVANGEAIELILDDKSWGSPRKGVIKNLEVTSQGIRIR
ncbi:MAG: RodZ domain-containing protein [Candidatus Omnitrophota bacterium]